MYLATNTHDSLSVVRRHKIHKSLNIGSELHSVPDCSYIYRSQILVKISLDVVIKCFLYKKRVHKKHMVILFHHYDIFILR